MKKITLILFSLFFCWSVNAQIGIQEGLNSTTLPTGWTNPNFYGANEFSGIGEQCEGSFGWRKNLYSFATTGILTTNNLVAASNGTDVTVSFEWRATEYGAGSGVGFTATAEYSIDNGTTWLPVGDAI